MGKLKLALVVLGLTVSTAAAADPTDQWSPYIAEAAVRFGVPEAWIRRVMRAESGGRTALGGRPIVSRAGAMGLMQLMPATWREMRSRYGLGTDPHAPRDNIIAGTAFLRAMYDRFGYPGLFAAYNAGPQRYAEYLGGRRLPQETVAYVAQVAGAGAVGRTSRPLRSAAPVAQEPLPPPLFVAGPARQVSGQSGENPAPAPAPSLFVPLSSAAPR